MSRELATLSLTEAEFNRLKSKLAVATLYDETYAKKAAEENVNADIAKFRFSNLQVAQEAAVPMRPTFPSYKLFMLMGIMAGGAVSVIGVLLPNRRLMRSIWKVGTTEFGKGDATSVAIERRSGEELRSL